MYWLTGRIYHAKYSGGFITRLFLSMENPQLGWGFRKAFSFKPVIKTPFDLLKHLAVWQLQKFNKKSKGGP
ncbi:invasin, partial [Salmonella enterica subsp. enterica serovar Typhimurium]|nr:invasin [Salmonella enterica subsp. enterica serovar Typhimurium]